MIAQFRLPVAGVCDRSQLQAFPRIWLPRSRRAGALNFACVNTFARMSSPGMVTMDGGKRETLAEKKFGSKRRMSTLVRLGQVHLKQYSLAIGKRGPWKVVEGVATSTSAAMEQGEVNRRSGPPSCYSLHPLRYTHPLHRLSRLYSGSA